jgi:predicted transglutaminase-like cysteine proteinase
VNKAITAVAALTALLAMTPSAAAAPPQLFGTAEFRAASLEALPKWQQTLLRIDQEQATYRACARASTNCPSRAAVAWQSVVRTQRDRPPIEQIQAVNRFLNEWRYKSDDQNYGRRDYWATPLEFLRHSGDCEDYAIAKYVTLRQLGFSPEQLRLVVVRDVIRDLAHAVLAVYVDEEVYILDNLTKAVLPQARIRQYVPYYSVNETTRWAHAAPVETLVSSRTERMTTPSAEAD